MTSKSAKEKSRKRILTLLKQNGPQEAKTLATNLKITDMAVRQHLYVMEENDEVCYRLEPRPKGRPAKLWQLTEHAKVHFPNAHAEFSTELIASIKQVFGDQGMEKLLDVRLQKQISDYSAAISTSSSMRDKLNSLAEIRTHEGYMARIIPDDHPENFLFVENNCPVCDAARECTGICARELDLFREVLGKDVNVKRSEHIIEGARRCAYQISKNSQ